MMSENFVESNFSTPGSSNIHNSTRSQQMFSNSIRPWLENSTRSTSLHTNHQVLTLEKYFRDNMYIYYGIVSPIISVFVLSINIILIITLIKGKFRKSTHVMIIAIAIADYLAGLVPLPFNFYVFGLERGTDYLTVTWCYVSAHLQKLVPDILHISSLHLTVGLGIERFIVVAFPLKAKKICTPRNGIIFSILIFTLSVCSQIDLFTQVSFESISIKSVESNTTINGCLQSEKVQTDAEYVSRKAFLILLPCVTLIIFTVLLLRKSTEIQRWRKLNSGSQQKSSNVHALERLDLAVLLIMIFVIVSEVTVWACRIISRIYGIKFTETHGEIVGIGRIVFQITSPINFVILCFLSSHFRGIFKRTFYCCVKKCNCFTFYKDKVDHRSSNPTDKEINNAPGPLQNTRF